MKVGEVSATNFRAMTPRTKQKLDESVKQLIVDMQEIARVTLNEDELLQRVELMFYAALRWTADDVLGQAVDDGYVSTLDGVE